MLNLKCCPNSEFFEHIGKNKILLFGAGKELGDFLANNPDKTSKILCILDNDKHLDGVVKHGFTVYHPDSFLQKDIQEDFVILITPKYYGAEIVEQLDAKPAFNGKDCYLVVLNNARVARSNFNWLKGEPKIPKIIHYCWFGGQPIPAHLQKCIDSWKKYCPEYEIIRWDESNYDVTKNTYMRQAYEAQKWAFVSDYTHLDVDYIHGGICLDADVELLKSLDAFLPYEFFCGFQTNRIVNFGLGFGAVKNHYLIGKCIEAYDGVEFIRDGMLNLVPSPVYQSAVLEKEGFLMNGKYQEINMSAVFPPYIFNPGSYWGSLFGLNEHNFSIHHYDGSWNNKQEIIHKCREDIRELYNRRIFGKEEEGKNI